jgi:Skp family chaperone for outer membrane proteins
MVASSRGIFAIGLGLAGLAYLVAPTLGQVPQQDGSVRKTTSPTPATPPAPVAPVIGTVDIELVFKSYEKVKVSNKDYNAALLARKNELMRIMSEAQEEAQMLSKFAPGTADYKKHEDRVTELKARHEAGREQAEREFAQRQAEAMATLYKEIQEMVKKVAQWRKMNYVVRVSNQPIAGSDPNSVMAAISSTLVYADNRNDITNDVIFNLNRFYKATAAPATRPAADAMPTPGVGRPAATNLPQGNGN